jgi:hypothetical protein
MYIHAYIKICGLVNVVVVCVNSVEDDDDAQINSIQLKTARRI